MRPPVKIRQDNLSNDLQNLRTAIAVSGIVIDKTRASSLVIGIAGADSIPANLERFFNVVEQTNGRAGS